MKRRLISLGCWMAGILIALAVGLSAAVFEVKELAYAATFLWAVWDSNRVQLWRYECGLSGRPSTLVVIGLALGWPLVFPCYLATRFSIWAGTIRLRQEFEPWRMSDLTVSPNGLLQPWRGKRIE